MIALNNSRAALHQPRFVSAEELPDCCLTEPEIGAEQLPESTQISLWTTLWIGRKNGAEQLPQAKYMILKGNVPNKKVIHAEQLPRYRAEQLPQFLRKIRPQPAAGLVLRKKSHLYPVVMCLPVVKFFLIVSRP